MVLSNDNPSLKGKGSMAKSTSRMTIDERYAYLQIQHYLCTFTAAK